MSIGRSQSRVRSVRQAPHRDEAIRDPCRRADVCGLVQRRVAGATAGAARVHVVGMSVEDAEHPRPVAAAGRIGQFMPHLEFPVARVPAPVDAVDPVPARLCQVGASCCG